LPMPRSLALLLALATLSASALAQNAYVADPADSTATSSYLQSQPAPIQRSAPGSVTTSRPIPGVVVRADQSSAVKTVSSGVKVTELRLDHGRANISVRHPENGTQILVDLPGGQTALLKDGFYTFNADTNTVRVLKGEAKAFPGQNAKPVKVKEYHQVVFAGPNPRSIEVDPAQARADLLPADRAREPRYGNGFYGEGPYGDGYGYPPYGYPYYAYGYPYGFYGYPYGYGYPFGFGIGFGFRGGFGGGFGGFRGHR
jgi:hypothetical protein